jgi:N-dimethylarginine dimethylaminohydrolase
VITVPLPHYKGPSDVFHLMSILSPVDKDLAVVYSPLMPVAFRNLLLQRGYQLVEVPDEEFESMGCNVLALSPRVCLMVDGNAKTKERLEAAGCTVIVYKGKRSV